MGSPLRTLLDPSRLSLMLVLLELLPVTVSLEPSRELVMVVLTSLTRPRDSLELESPRLRLRPTNVVRPLMLRRPRPHSMLLSTESTSSESMLRSTMACSRRTSLKFSEDSSLNGPRPSTANPSRITTLPSMLLSERTLLELTPRSLEPSPKLLPPRSDTEPTRLRELRTLLEDLPETVVNGSLSSDSPMPSVRRELLLR